MSAVSPVAPVASADAASALYERHGSRVLRFCLSRLGSREDAEDAAQTTFLNAVGALRRGTVPRSEAAWLLRIAENVCHHRHRTAARRNEAACDPTVLEDVVAAAPGRPDELIHLAAGLESLPERQRRALLLREWQGLSYDEIGAEMGLSHSAVETLLFRARRSLAQALEQADGRKRRGLDLVSLLGWVKTAVGGGVGLKVAATVVVAGVAVVPIHDSPAPAPVQKAQTPAVVAAVPAHTPTAPATAPKRFEVAVQRTTVAAPRAQAARPETARPSKARGGRRAAVEPEPAPLAPKAKEPTAPTTPPPTQAPKADAPVSPAPTLPVEPPAELPLPIPPLPEVNDVAPPLPAPVPLPEAPKLPDVTAPLPEVQAPQLPVPGLLP